MNHSIRTYTTAAACLLGLAACQEDLLTGEGTKSYNASYSNGGNAVGWDE
ncbi:hypothetical protein [Phocaeicola coprophilus]|jgi:hypothetical protein|nr:hypothetical protein [Phocaeicola coprophilus]